MKISPKILRGILALLGLWEFADITALFVPDFGRIQSFVWNHIIVGLIFMLIGIWGMTTRGGRTAKTLSWITVVSGVWLMVVSVLLRRFHVDAGLWNDVIVGGVASVLGVWTARLPFG